MWQAWVPKTRTQAGDALKPPAFLTFLYSSLALAGPLFRASSIPFPLMAAPAIGFDLYTGDSATKRPPSLLLFCLPSPSKTLDCAPLLHYLSRFSPPILSHLTGTDPCRAATSPAAGLFRPTYATTHQVPLSWLWLSNWEGENLISITSISNYFELLILCSFIVSRVKFPYCIVGGIEFWLMLEVSRWRFQNLVQWLVMEVVWFYRNYGLCGWLLDNYW